MSACNIRAGMPGNAPSKAPEYPGKAARQYPGIPARKSPRVSGQGCPENRSTNSKLNRARRFAAPCWGALAARREGPKQSALAEGRS